MNLDSIVNEVKEAITILPLKTFHSLYHFNMRFFFTENFFNLTHTLSVAMKIFTPILPPNQPWNFDMHDYNRP